MIQALEKQQLLKLRKHLQIVNFMFYIEIVQVQFLSNFLNDAGLKKLRWNAQMVMKLTFYGHMVYTVRM